jgi:hypothetical protein
MHTNYHIPTPQFDPTESEKQWVIDNVAPHLYPALNVIKGAFDRVDIQQSLFDAWPQRAAVEEHFAALGLKIRRFAGFISNKNFNPVIPHIDAYTRGTPMVARFNIVYQGQSPVTLSWWNEGVGNRIEERSHTELRNGVERTAYSYKANTTEWPAPAYSVQNPGAGWNRTDLAHRADGVDCNVNRIIITTEVANQTPWDELVERLAQIGY